MPLGPDFNTVVVKIAKHKFLLRVWAKKTENRSFSIIVKIPKLFILFVPENRFLIEVETSTKKNLKAEMPNLPTKLSENFYPDDVTFAGGGTDTRHGQIPKK